MRTVIPAFAAAALATGCAGLGGPQSEDIRNAQWRAVEIGGRAAVTTHRPASLLLAARGEAGGSGGCNHWFAPYRLQGNTISFGQIGSTLIGCDGPVAEQERAYFDILRTVDRYSIRPDGALTLATPQGQTITFLRVGQTG